MPKTDTALQCGLGLHWFRRGFGRGVVHVELSVLVKLIQTN